jgi:hypothetical protein
MDSVTLARAEASRINGARSHGRVTNAGKERSSRNRTRHGLDAEKHLLLAGEGGLALAALAQALEDDLRPKGARHGACWSGG